MFRVARIGQIVAPFTSRAPTAVSSAALFARPSTAPMLPPPLPPPPASFDATDLYLTGLSPPGDPRLVQTSAQAAAPLAALRSYYASAWYPRTFGTSRPDLPRTLDAVSTYRSFADQASIVQAFVGGTGANLSDASQVRAALLQNLQTRSIPGFSRHHWGTDLDVVSPSRDAWRSTLAPLVPFTRTVAPQFGFYTPYWEGRYPDPGAPHYLDEPWHLSYAPLASGLRSEWLARFQGDKLTDLLAYVAQTLAAPLGADPQVFYRALASLDLPSYVRNVAPPPSRVASPLPLPATTLTTLMRR
jgi:hypothetical protein